MAFGATPADVRSLIARQALRALVPGLAVGVPAAWIAARLLSRQLAGLLYELTPTDPATMAAAALALVLVAIGAAMLPARRAARIDPVAALRAE